MDYHNFFRAMLPPGYDWGRSVSLSFPGKPKAVQSFRFANAGKFARKYQPQETLEWKNYIRLLAMEQLGEDWIPIKAGTPTCVLYYFAFPFPADMSKKEQARIEAGEARLHARRPDMCDNLRKGLNDALSGVVWEDDAVIAMDSGVKAMDFRPRIEMHVYELVKKQ